MKYNEVIHSKHFCSYTTLSKSIFAAGSDYEINTVHASYQFVDYMLLTELKATVFHIWLD